MAKSFARTDKFGNPYKVVGIKDKKENGFPYGYVEIKGQLYKLDVSPAEKEGTEYWVRMTQLKKRPSNSGF